MEVFVGIPSVVYGWLGLTILVPFLRQNFRALGFTLGFSWFAGSLVLSLMILPTITSIAYDVIAIVPAATCAPARSPSAPPAGRRSATSSCPRPRRASSPRVVLGMMRAAGEALAVQMVIGNRPVIPTGADRSR